MIEVDDRLVGDPVWELFAQPAPDPTQATIGARDYRRWLAWAGLVVVGWLLYPPMVVVGICLAVAVPDVRAGRRLSRSIPDKGARAACARFTYAWGAWKLGAVAFGLMCVSLGFVTGARGQREMPPAFAAAMILWMGGFVVSAALTASGLMAVYRSGMRIWVGEGVNQARTLILAMLIVAFSIAVVGPMCVGLIGLLPRPTADRGLPPLILLGLYGVLLGGPLLIVLILDWLAHRVIADHPGKFGPKVPTVGKWNSELTRTA